MVNVLAKPADSDEVLAAIFSLTTTLGVRRELTDRAILPRQEVVVRIGEHAYRVKVSKRPSGYTAKVEMDDLVAADLGRAAQDRIRAEAERLALAQVES